MIATSPDAAHRAPVAAGDAARRAPEPDADLRRARRLRRVHPAAALATNRLYGMAAFELDLGARGRARLRWCANDAGGALLRSRARYRFRLGAQTGELVLGEPAQALLLDEPRAVELPYALRCVLVADIAGPTIAALEAASAERFEWLPLDAALSDEPILERAVSFELALAAQPGRVERGCIVWDDDAAFAALVERLPEAAAARPLSQLRLPLAFALGETTLGLAELGGITRGDIVAVERWMPLGNAIAGHLVLGRACRTSLIARIEDRRATLEPWKEFTMTSLAHDHEAGDAAPVPIGRLDALEVALRFEVGQLSVSLRDLRGLAPGHVFDLAQPLERSTVRIYAHGNLLGHGHLVAVGERLGVRVAEFAPDLR